MEAAILWGLTPSQFFAASSMDRAMMLAHYRERNMRKSMLDKIQAESAEKKAKPRSSPSHDAFFSGLPGLTGGLPQ